VIWAVAALAADCDCACQEARARSASRAVEALEGSGGGGASAGSWRTTAAATCAWAESIARDPVETCLPTASCVRMLAETRLATLSAVSPAARAADLAHLTGRFDCRPDAGAACAIDARRAEEQRLFALVRALTELRLDPHDAQRYWLGYRDGACVDESRDPVDDQAWAQAACEAVRTHRRVELLAGLASVAAPAERDTIERARLDEAARELPGHGRPWNRWLARVDQVEPARVATRRAIEARADHALFPPLLETRAWSSCATPGSAECLAAVRAETRARRDRVAPPLEAEPEERSWRARWCGRGSDQDAVACQAALDLVVESAFLTE
jgi:hypothetical protein